MRGNTTIIINNFNIIFMRKTLICILLLQAAMNIFAQTYTYDNVGNRTGRVIALKAPQAPNGKESVTALSDLIVEKAL
jgi:hypothetical protein